MTRQAQLLAALVGLWGGAFAWNRAAVPRQERVARLTHTGGRPVEVAAPAWPERPTLRAEDRVVVRDLFTVPKQVVATLPAASPMPAPAAAPWKYVGFVADGSGRKVLLSGEGGITSAAEGDLLPGGWRLERIETEAIVVKNVVTNSETNIPRGQ